MHFTRGMSTKRVARTYDEIVRDTVRDLEGSVRPTAHQEQFAREGHRELEPYERKLRDRVLEALEEALRTTTSTWAFQVDIDRDTVKLRGQVRDAAMLRLIEKTVKSIEGVVDVDNRITIAH